MFYLLHKRKLLPIEDGTIWAGVRWMCDGMGMSEG